MRNLSLLLAATAILSLPAPAQAPVFQQDLLLAPAPQASENMGGVVAFDSVRLCAGIPRHFATFNNAGAVLTWPRSGNGFGAPNQILAPTPANSGEFGTAIALEGNELLVGEKNSTYFGAPSRGVVHRYVDSGSGWSYVDTLQSGFANTAGFGQSLARDGDLLAVGAQFSQQHGQVLLYRLVGGAWVYEATLSPSNAGVSDRFGFDVAVSGDRVIVGAPYWRQGNVQVGAGYAFERVGGSWVETNAFSPDPSTTDLGFGTSVAISGNTAVISASRTNDPGAAYVYAYAPNSWTQVQRIRPANLGTYATFGHSVELQGDQLIIGAYQDSVVGHLTGSAWVFERSLGTFEPSLRLVQSGTPAFFGLAVGLDGQGTYIVGRPNGQAAGAPPASGGLYVFRPDSAIGTSYCDGVLNSSQRPGALGALGSSVAADNHVTLIAHQLPNNSFGIFVTAQTQGFIPQAGGSLGNLCLGGSLGRYNQPGQLGNSGLLGTFALQINLLATPTPFQPTAILAGQTWHFQAWYRDIVSGQSVSNFTEGLSITFQ